MNKTAIRAVMYRTFMVLVVTSPAASQARPADAAVILQAASHQETVIGNLDSAITLYRRVADDRRADRRSVASALVSLGRAYELRGQADAVRAYQRVVNEFGDQSEHAATARLRLAALRAGPNAVAGARDKGVLSMVYADLPPLRTYESPHYDLSPNGEQIVMRMRADPLDSTQGTALVLANSGGAVLRTLIPARREVAISFPRWSPDGKYIAFREGAWLGAETSFVAVKLIPAEGGTPRTITNHVPIAGSRGGMFWTPDSRHITVVNWGGIFTLDLDGRVVRNSPFHIGNLTQVTGYSPDGRWLVLHRLPKGSQEQQLDVYVMPAEGGEEIRVTQGATWNSWPEWGPGGRSIYFISNRGGTQNVWRVGFDPRTGRAVGEPVQVTSYTDVSVKHPKVLQGAKLAFALIRETGTINLASTARPEDARALVRGSNATLSPDGRTVYFVGQGMLPGGIFAIATDSSAIPRRLTPTRPDGSSLSADGRTIAYFNMDGRQKTLRTVNVATGAIRDLVPLSTREQLTPAWSPDGSQVAYAHQSGLFVIPASGGEPRKLAEAHRWEGWTVQWSPDGQYLSALAYVSPADSANTAVIVPASGGALRAVTPRSETGYKEVLQWHPDGRRLSYMYYGHNDQDDETRFAYLDGRPTTKLLNQPYPIWDYTGTWHPGGRDYYFIGSTSGSWSLYVHNEPSNASRLVVHHKGAFPGVSRPSFSRDGSVMAFATATTTRQLWVIDGVSPR